MKCFFGGRLLGDVPETVSPPWTGQVRSRQTRWPLCLSITSHPQRRYILLKAFFKKSLLNLLQYCFWVFFQIFYWSIIALQYCAGFCRTSTWITHRHARPRPLEPPPPPTPPLPSRSPQSTGLSSPPAVPFTHGTGYASTPLSRFLPLSSSPAVSPSLLFLSASPLLPDREQASVLCVALLATRHVGSWLPDQGSNLHRLPEGGLIHGTHP